MTKDEIIRYYERTRQQLFDAITGLTEEQMRRRPGPEGWSTVEVLAHLPASERRIRLQASAACRSTGSEIAFLSEPERQEAAARGLALPAPAIIHDLIAARRETVEFLKSLPPDDLAKRGRHPQFGEMTVDRILGAISYHEREHVEQIRSLRQKLGLDGGTSP
jgi:uncharacterized damage-inducible protein DinB